ncbi:MAG: exo-alpha-sialidase [Phycisphaerae bacterium]|nr:exo-alpha-sialidase [Phycisphaerae bacterium]
MRGQLAASWLVVSLTLVPAMGAEQASSRPAAREVSGKRLGTIFNNDSNNIIWHMGVHKKPMTPQVYQEYVYRILDLKPGVVAQCVGFPEGTLYPTQVGTSVDKYWAEVCHKTWPKEDQFQYAAQIEVLKRLFEAGTDPLALTIEACRRRGVPVVASYRMNAEDLYGNTWMLSDFGRAHPEYRIPGRGCLDPAIPAVYAHRMKIFREVAERYDIDGIELDFRRWYFMVSDPLKNHTVLTRMVADTRKMLDEVAKRKGKKRLMLGARVSPMLEGKFDKAEFPGAYYGEPENLSCRNLGLDVKAWIQQGLVDYICPSLFSPMGVPRVKEFVGLARGTDVGVYPTISYVPGWAHDSAPNRPVDGNEARRRHRDDICKEALKCYEEGADGIGLFNWFPHLSPAGGQEDSASGQRPQTSEAYGPSARGFGRVLQLMMPKLASAQSLRECLGRDLPATSVRPTTSTSTTTWKPHIVRQLNGGDRPIGLGARFQIVTERWNRVVAVPYIVYMPERDRLLMLVSCDYPHHPMVLHSDDRGATWSEPRPVGLDNDGKIVAALGTSLAYLGDGKVIFHGVGRWLSQDYGQTWAALSPRGPTPDGKPWYIWDPPLASRDAKTGKVVGLVETGYTWIRPPEVKTAHQQAYLRWSRDEGKTWDQGIKVPQWEAVSEVALIRAANGDLVAACRTDIPARMKGETLDHYEGLGISLSKDGGRTWSPVKKLYDWGRHHPSFVRMPNNDLVMTYVVRKGYVETADGFPQFGIEAVISRDHGQTWDLDHRYILHQWIGHHKGANAWWPSSQATSSVLLPDGSILTVFGTGYRCQADAKGMSAPRDVGLVLWSLNDGPVNSERRIGDAPFDSESRNVFDPSR